MELLLARVNNKKLDSWGGVSLMSFLSNSTCPHRPSQMVWRRAWYNTGNMCSFRPPTRANTLAPQVWAYYRPFLRTGGYPGIWMMWHQRINTPFAPNSCILASSSRRKTYKSRRRCSGRSTKKCGKYGWTLILQNFARWGASVHTLLLVWFKILRVDK